MEEGIKIWLGGGGIQNWKVPNPTAFLGSPTNVLINVINQVFEGTKTKISASSVVLSEIKTKIEQMVYNSFNSVEKDFLSGLPEKIDNIDNIVELETILNVLKNLKKKIKYINKPNSLHKYYSDDYVERRMKEKTKLVVSLYNFMGRLVYYDSVADGFKDTTNLTEIFGSTIATLLKVNLVFFQENSIGQK